MHVEVIVTLDVVVTLFVYQMLMAGRIGRR